MKAKLYLVGSLLLVALCSLNVFAQTSVGAPSNQINDDELSWLITPSPGSLRLVDANGIDVGLFFPNSSGVLLKQKSSKGRTTVALPNRLRDSSLEEGTVIRYLPASNRWLMLSVKSDFIRGNPRLIYESLDCTGYAYALYLAKTNSDAVLNVATVGSSGNVYYMTGKSPTKNFYSMRDDIDRPCRQANSDIAPLVTKGQIFESFPLSSLGLTPPFRLSR